MGLTRKHARAVKKAIIEVILKDLDRERLKLKGDDEEYELLSELETTIQERMENWIEEQEMVDRE